MICWQQSALGQRDSLCLFRGLFQAIASYFLLAVRSCELSSEAIILFQKQTSLKLIVLQYYLFCFVLDLLACVLPGLLFRIDLRFSQFD